MDLRKFRRESSQVILSRPAASLHVRLILQAGNDRNTSVAMETSGETSCGLLQQQEKKLFRKCWNSRWILFSSSARIQKAFQDPKIFMFLKKKEDSPTATQKMEIFRTAADRKRQSGRRRRGASVVAAAAGTTRFQ